MCNYSIHHKGRENRESLATNKALTLCATLANQRPAYLPSQIFLVARSFVNEDELSRISDEISNIVHIGRAFLVISFKSLDRDQLAREVKLLKCAQKSRNRDIDISSIHERVLQFIQVHARFLIQ